MAGFDLSLGSAESFMDAPQLSAADGIQGTNPLSAIFQGLRNVLGGKPKDRTGIDGPASGAGKDSASASSSDITVTQKSSTSQESKGEDDSVGGRAQQLLTAPSSLPALAPSRRVPTKDDVREVFLPASGVNTVIDSLSLNLPEYFK